jgi:tRNA(Ile)-lysidine synthase TilS/MesJ
MRKAVSEFDLLQNGDRLAVGVSGGKDSLALLTGLVMLKRFIGFDYDVSAVTIDPRFGGEDGDYSGVRAYCAELGVAYEVVESDIAVIVFDIRRESNPCSLCARLRRGALHDAALRLGCNKVALGHNFEDAVETFVMNLFNEGRLGCFSPKTYLSRKGLTVIRPLVFAPEKVIKGAVSRHSMPVVKSKCPADGHTSREEVKRFLSERDRLDSGFSYRLFGAMRRAGLDGWGKASVIPPK